MDIGTRKKGGMNVPRWESKNFLQGGGRGGTRYLFFIDHIASKRNLFILNYTQILRIDLLLHCTLVIVVILAALLNFN